MGVPLTPSQTVGPYLALGLDWEDGHVADTAGVRVGGRVLDGKDDPVPDALVETWDPVTSSFCRSLTDDEGRWWVRTPPASALWVGLFARGLLRGVVTRAYLGVATEDDALLAVPLARRATLIAMPHDDGYRFDIHIQGAAETVFFDV